MSVLRIRLPFVALPVGSISLLICLGGGCAGPGAPPTTDTSAMETPADASSEEQPTAAADQPPAQEPPEGAEDRAKRVLEQTNKEKTLIQQKNEFLVGRYVDAAKGAMNQGDYAKAEESLLRARELDATNAEVNTLFAQVEEALGKRGGEIENVKDELTRRRLAAAQQQMFRAESLEAEADKAMAEKRYADAINALEEVVSIATWNPYAEVDFGAMRQRAEAKLALAKQNNRRFAEEQRRTQAREAYQTLQKEEAKERQARVDRIRALMEDAVDRFDRNDFQAAEQLADQILDIDPQFKAAKDLKESSRIARHDKFNADFVSKKREQYRSWLEDVRTSMVPDGDFLSWPSQAYWDDIRRKRAYAGSVGAADADSPAVQKIKNQLANIRMDLEFEDATLPAVIDYIRSFTGINIVLDPEVAAEAGTATIKLTLKQVPVRTALNIVLASQENLTYTFRDDVLLITKKDKALGKPVPQIHDVRDIAFGLANFTSPDIRLRTGESKGENEKPIFGDFKEKEPELKAEDLIELVRSNVAPESWDGQPGTIDATSAGLLVVHTPEVQRQVSKFLNDLRQFLGASVLIESRFLTVTDNFLQDVGVDFRGLGGQKGDLASLDDVTNGLEDNASAGFDNNGQGLATNSSGSPSSGAFFNQGKNEYRARTENLFTRTLGKSLSSTGGLTLQWAYLDDLQLNFVLRSVQKSDHATQLTAPRITAYNTQQASIHVINQIAYIQDFEVEVAQTAFIADPVIGIIQDGLVLDVRPTISNDRKYVNLELKPTVARLKQPIPTFTTQLGGLTQAVTIQLPELEISRAATTVLVPDGGTVMIGGLRNVTSVDRKSETPFFADIPLIGFLFSRKGKSEEMRDLLVVVTVHINDVAEEEQKLRH